MLTEWIKLIGIAGLALFLALYAYQGVYLLIGLLRRPATPSEPDRLHRFAVVISARNEELVIGNLLQSLREQKYPQRLVDVYVIADNCTDQTAQVARSCGAMVLERFNRQLVGKGYALDEFFQYIRKGKGLQSYDGYFVFDADNVLDPNYIFEMNRTFCQGYDILTSYRNSKNYGSSWISAGYALWFLRESRFLNEVRMGLGSSCIISGTGFLVSSSLLERDGGWNYHLLTEDIQFSADHVARGDRIGYCKDAILYDEQPVDFASSWKQRTRWLRGFYQVLGRYGARLARGIAGKHPLSCYDMLMSVIPAPLLSLVTLGIDVLLLFCALISDEPEAVAAALHALVCCLVNAYFPLLLLGGITLLSERKQIHCPLRKQVGYLFTFPLFLFTYLPVAAAALSPRVSWKPIAHTMSCSVEQIVSS